MTSPITKKEWYYIIGILLLTAATFWGVKNCDFLSNWDDDGYVIKNTHIYEISGENIANWFSSFYKSNYQPLSVMTYAFEFAFFQLQPKAYHITNLLFHLLNTVLVFAFIKKLTKSTTASIITGLLFAIHPMHVESVAWISERKDVVYAAFFIWSLILWLSYIDSSSKKSYWQAFAVFILSCLSKSMAVTLPAVLLALDYYRGRELSLKLITEKIPFFLISILFGVVALFSQSGSAMDIVPDFSILDRIFIVFYGVFFYIQKLFLPIGLCSIHYYPDNSKALPIIFYLSPFILALIAWGVYKAKKLQKELIFGIAFFVFSISIVLQLIPVGHAFASERYSYVPYVGLFFIIGVFYDKLINKSFPKLNSFKTPLLGVLVLATLVFSYLSKDRISVWENSIKLYTDVTLKYPNTSHAHWMLGNVKKDYKMFQQSLSHYDKAIALDPQYAKAYFNRGGSKANLNKPLEAIKDYNLSIKYDPKYEPAYNNRGNSYFVLKQYDKAITDYQQCFTINPEYALPYVGCANAYQQTKEYPKAIEHYNKAIALDDKYAEAYHNRGVAHYNSGNKPMGCEDWKKALSLNYQASTNFVKNYCK